MGVIRKRSALLALGVLCAALLSAAPALGYDEVAPIDTVCTNCHSPGAYASPTSRTGPHGGYILTSSGCANCHEVHKAAPGGVVLLPGTTLTETCLTCHDGTGGGGVYGTIAARGGSVGASHGVDVTNVVPGGSSSTGGSATMVFTGEGGSLGCGDCHSAHGANVVQPFLGERQRSYPWWQETGMMLTVMQQSRLLKRTPGGSTAVDEYGSDWCLGCHAGRASGGMIHNHPVESRATAATPYTYNNLPVFKQAGTAQSQTVMGMMGSTPNPWGGSLLIENYPFLWPVPRTALQDGRYPICQQCHEDTRDVGTLTADGTQAVPEQTVVTVPDGYAAGDNPRFQNFPHETLAADLLVETADDLCTNCHVMQ